VGADFIILCENELTHQLHIVLAPLYLSEVVVSKCLSKNVLHLSDYVFGDLAAVEALLEGARLMLSPHRDERSQVRFLLRVW
jgi:hypothetical protein